MLWLFVSTICFIITHISIFVPQRRCTVNCCCWCCYSIFEWHNNRRTIGKKYVYFIWWWLLLNSSQTRINESMTYPKKKSVDWKKIIIDFRFWREKNLNWLWIFFFPKHDVVDSSFQSFSGILIKFLLIFESKRNKKKQQSSYEKEEQVDNRVRGKN